MPLKLKLCLSFASAPVFYIHALCQSNRPNTNQCSLAQPSRFGVTRSSHSVLPTNPSGLRTRSDPQISKTRLSSPVQSQDQLRDCEIPLLHQLAAAYSRKLAPGMCATNFTPRGFPVTLCPQKISQRWSNPGPPRRAAAATIGASVPQFPPREPSRFHKSPTPRL